MVLSFLPFWHEDNHFRLSGSTESAKCAPLIIASRLSLHHDHGEVLSVSQAGVGVYDGEAKSPFQNGTLVLTTHRLFYVFSEGAETTAARSCFLWLHQVNDDSLTRTNGFGTWSHPKISIVVRPHPTDNGAALRPYKFSFRQGGVEAFWSNLTLCLQRKLWAVAPPERPSAALTTAGATAHNHGDQHQQPQAAHDVLHFTDRAGIQGLHRTQQLGATSMEGVVSSAMADVESVLAHATRLVQDIKKLRAAIAGSGSSTDANSAAAHLTAEDLSKLISVEEALGLSASSPSSSAELSPKTLAQEVLAWVSHPTNSAVLMQRCFIPMAEFYSLYSIKAAGRRSSAIQPALFLDAMTAMSDMTRVMSASAIQASRSATTQPWHFAIQRFRCGVVVLQCCSDEAVIAMLQQFIGKRPICFSEVAQQRTLSALPSIDASSLSIALQVDVAVAEELLENLELDEVLCRDEAGPPYSRICRFSWNVFLLP